MVFAHALTNITPDPDSYWPSPIAENVETSGIVCCQDRTYSKCAEILHSLLKCVPKFHSSCFSSRDLYRSLKREIILPTLECYLISTWTYTMLHPMLWGLLLQLYVEWKSLVLKRWFLTGLMRFCGFPRHMRCQLACMPVRFNLRNFWSMTMVSALLCRSHTWRF